MNNCIKVMVFKDTIYLHCIGHINLYVAYIGCVLFIVNKQVDVCALKSPFSQPS